MPTVRKGQFAGELPRQEFRRRFLEAFIDPAFKQVQAQLDAVEAVAWDGYSHARKSPLTAKAGAGFADPDYELSVVWREARDRILAAAAAQRDPATPSRVLLICGSPRNDGTCPGEISKTFRLVELARAIFEREGIDVDLLDLSLLASEYGRRIHPCKGCVSTAMPLCHWPCSCYPNHSLGQTQDWMNEIYERWSAAHGVLIVTPVHWYQATSPLKLMIDRLVCADGGNPDPTLTGGKNPERAKAVELAGWDYPQHLAGRVYGVAVHGDVAGTEGVRRALCDWLDWIGLVDAGPQARLDRMLGYYEPYASSHDALDRDDAVQREVENVARAVAEAVRELRAGTLSQPDAKLQRPRPK
jgi:multimeric flavodoxin WrbA